MQYKNLIPIIILASILLLMAGIGYTGYASHSSRSTNILVGHYLASGPSTGPSFISILNKGSVEQNVTLKLWRRDGTFDASTSNIINPNAQWRLATGSAGGGPLGTSSFDGHFTIEANDVSKLFVQAYVSFSPQGPLLPITISPFSQTTQPSPTPTATRTPSARRRL